MKTIIVVAGPTAVGKTACAIELASYFNTVILSADSRQCFQELNIGVARPTVAELQMVPHFFIASHSIHEELNAAWYETYSLNLLHQLFETKDIVVVCGGTGLYIKALTEGLDTIPEVGTTIRQKIVSGYKENGIGWLKQELLLKDPLFASQGEMQNPQRMMRALEVVEATGQSIISFHKKDQAARPFNIIKLGLELSRDILYERINARVDAMMEAGLEEEVRQLLPYRKLNALHTVGYREMFDYFDGETSKERAIELIKQNTRHYAKRQMTWFKKQENMHWVDLELTKNLSTVVALLFQGG
ncbi:MAG TPA: tRNA (adenosine(37)-N6)-dimethylallyltransferase MiaA [Niabella sp.]|nr:tRNA (adenosine(37)-N6)-dimethylallyltransferase MiaA [Niabella sp.]HQW14896.1 tRNA (adenosine(37)-N6)-dimethylallyltransferase MiaA [Niabella sp.]HRB36858.1 tRNA (adenosine(37)-N6)-dimethylallyltransferase MiaA [Niabella sp.]HRB41290.1 tRNA (adenosine(37)-N6)-dimethylallyltransferase MiaA [Niabella sp.]HRB64512.1 tRNA (adenosine(37)-N6)-dimethylallyltransferase MiaA [Niabella sp.]